MNYEQTFSPFAHVFIATIKRERKCSIEKEINILFLPHIIIAAIFKQTHIMNKFFRKILNQHKYEA